mgnify:CR=1 FL=1
MHISTLRTAAALITLLGASAAAAQASPAPPVPVPTPAPLRAVAAPTQVPDDTTAALRAAALADGTALSFLTDLTTQIGPRPAGTPAEARARDWAVARLRSLGFQNVRIEDFRMPVWERGAESGAIVAPYRMPLALTALGGSAPTPAGGIEGAVVVFPDLAAFDAAPDSAVRGQIVYIGHQMRRTQDGSSYGAFGPVRFSGPDRAAKRGVRAIVIRSIGTDQHRNPHTGQTNFSAGVTPIPAVAISNPDADQLERLGTGTRVQLNLASRRLENQPGGNVIAEMPGNDPSLPVVLAACHIDSWDLATGVMDDAAGCGIVTAAARLAAQGQRPRRTIRVLLAGAEEVGVFGGRAYAEAHGNTPHAAALEADFGGDRVYKMTVSEPIAAHAGLMARFRRGLLPLSVSVAAGDASGGADVGATVARGVPAIDLEQDGTRYFDLHHTPDDTLDKVDPAQLSQAVAAWAVTLRLLADAPEAIGRGG